MLGCDTHIVCIDEVTRSAVYGMIVSVDGEQYWGKDASLWQAISLCSLSATLVVQYHIESSAGQHILNDCRGYCPLWFHIAF